MNKRKPKQTHTTKGDAGEDATASQAGSKRLQSEVTSPPIPPSEAENRRLLRKLARQVPALRATILQIKTEADGKRNFTKIVEGIVDSCLDDIERCQKMRRTFALPEYQKFAELKAELQKVKLRISSAALT